MLVLAFAAGAHAETACAERPVEARAMWIDANSIPLDDAGIAELVEKMHRANLNLALPEVFRRGYTIYPSSLTTQDPRWKPGFDPLASFIRHAHLRGIEVHPWVWVFRQGYTNNLGPILTPNPEWIAKNKLGEDLSANGGYWICPSHPDARDYLSSVFKYLVRRYDIDGLHLDYIRFENQEPTPYCYNDSCRTKFKKEYGIDPIDIDPLSPEQINWHLWRERQINTFVQRVVTEARSTRPGIIISAAVASDPVGSRSSFMQNWVNWIDNRWLDFVSPMAYASDLAKFDRIASKSIEAVGEKTLVFPGIGIIQHKTPEQTLEQIRYTREKGTLGQAFFAAVYWKEPWEEAFSSGPFAKPAVLPFRKPHAALALLEDRPDYAEDAMAVRRYLERTARETKYVAPSPPPIFIPENPLPLGKVEIPRTAEKITIDGRMDENSWTTAGVADIAHTDFADPAPVSTQARLLYDDENLYIAFSAREPHMDKIKATVDKRDGPTFYDDSIEMFIDITGRGVNYYHLSANTLGTLFDQQGYNTGWNPEWEVAVTKTGDGWILEAAIPFSSLKTETPQSGDRWRGNLGRSRWVNPATEFFIWSVPYGGFHRAERFGWLIYK